ncbi:MAG: FKBP-type peptidyl-prolyl cis-trans isomerase [Gemmatimonadales bacterium]
MRLPRVTVAAGLLLCVIGPQQAVAQQLQLRSLSPVASYQLAPILGIPEDSLHTAGRGIWYHDVQLGDGTPIRPGDSLSVHFVGFLANGERFTATELKPYHFRLGADQVIAGWEDGVTGMRVGGRRQLIIPPALGYGAKGKGAIPPNAVLVFDITVVDAIHPEKR